MSLTGRSLKPPPLFLPQVLSDMMKPNLLSCYQKIGSLQEKLQHLQERFGFSNITGVIHSAQIDLQQVHKHKHTQLTSDLFSFSSSAVRQLSSRVSHSEWAEEFPLSHCISQHF